MSQPSREMSVTVESPISLTPDLDILHISRSPKYPRFVILYDPPGYNPHPDPATENQQHYPAIGEMMTYTATIRNSGGVTSEPFILTWYVDSVLVQTENCDALYPRQRLS